MSARAHIEERILVLAPSAHDGPVAANVLARAGFACVLVRDVPELCLLLEEGAAAALVAEEALSPAAARRFSKLLQRQEPWSDLPVILFTAGAAGRVRRLSTVEAIAPFGNVTLLDRPFEVITLVSAVHAALRARRRQYGARAVLAELDATLKAQYVLQDELRASESRFRVMADGTPLIIWVTDAAGNIEFVNRAYCEFFGTTLEAVQAQGWQPLIHPDDAPVYVGAYALAAAERKPFHAEARVRRSDGAWRWIESSGVPRFSPQGAFLGFAGSSPDISERKETEEALRRSESLFRTVSDANLIGVGFGDLSGRVEHVNDEMLRMMGYTRADFEAGRVDWARSIAPEFAEANRASLEALLRDGVSIGYENSFLRPDGGRTPFVGAAALVDRATGFHVSIALDLTARKQAEVELREADRRKTEFLGLLSHELRNPLAPIRNSVYLLAHASPGTVQAVRAREVVERQTTHLARLVDDLLDVTRIAQGKIELRRVRLDACHVVRRTCDDHRSLLEARGIELDVRSSRPAWIDADPTRLAQMVGNLLHNAAKFSREGDTVSVTVSATDSAARIAVRDEGMGIAPELLPRLFNPFVQADDGLSRAQGGLGLGLSLVKGLAELHGGTARAQSEGLGKGAEFVIDLPLSLAPVESPPAPRARALRRSLRILVVDDNLDGARTLADVLELEGHSTFVATDGRGGLEKAREERPDVVICDLGLPDMDGFQVARAIRAEAVLASTRLVALSGYAQPEDRQRSLEAGFDAHLAKPPDPEDLLRVLGASNRAAGDAAGTGFQ